MIFYRGYGALIAILSFAIMIGTEYLVETEMKNEQYYQTEFWPIFVAFSISGIVAYLVGKAVNKEENHHSLFFIPIQYLIFIFPVVGFIFGATK